MAATERLTIDSIAALVVERVNDIEEAATWVAVALAESGGSPVAYNLVDRDPTSEAYLSTDNGLFQINSYWHGGRLPVHEANRPDLAWEYAWNIGTGNGSHPSDWSPWIAYRTEAHLKYMDDARAAVVVLLEPEEPMPKLTDRPIPPTPDYFGPDGAPGGVELRLSAFERLDNGVAWLASRPTIKQRVGVVHTNAASQESTAESQERWGRNTSTPQGNNTTKPHYIVDRTSARKVLRSDLRGIANSTGPDYERAYNEVDCSFWSYAIETSDTGYKNDPGISDFLGDGPEVVAQILAYESIVGGYEIEIPKVWNGSGVVTHTWPFPYPAFTTKKGKTCPGDKKKATFRDQIVPRARQIRAAWLAPVEQLPDPNQPEDEDMIFIKPKAPYFAGGVFTIDGHPVSPEALAALKAAGPVTTVEQDHEWWDAATWDKLGSDARRRYIDLANK